MAKCKINAEVTLTLTMEEAIFLRRLLGHHVVGNDPIGDAIHMTLSDMLVGMGIPNKPFDCRTDSSQIHIIRY